jgi:photosystem II stability/assembly factor-like uncharacterized protein
MARRRSLVLLPALALATLLATFGCRARPQAKASLEAVPSASSEKPAPSQSAVPPLAQVELVPGDGAYFASARVAAISDGDEFAVTTDAGASWRVVAQPAGVRAAGAVYVDADALYVLADNALHFAGPTDKVLRPLRTPTFTMPVASFADAKRGWLAEGSTIARTRDGGVTWATATLVIPSLYGAMQRPSFAVSGGLLEVVFWEPMGIAGRFLSSDDGATFKPAHDCELATRHVDGTLIVCVESHWSGDALARSTDGGTTWKRPALPKVRAMPDPRGGTTPVTHRLRVPIAVGPTRATLLTTDLDEYDRVLLVSEDRGETWRAEPLPVKGASEVRAPGALWLVDNAGSTEIHQRAEGASWSKVRPRFVGPRPDGVEDVQQLDALSFAEGKVVWGTVSALGTSAVVRSTDGGATWAFVRRSKK